MKATVSISSEYNQTLVVELTPEDDTSESLLFDFLTVADVEHDADRGVLIVNLKGE